MVNASTGYFTGDELGWHHPLILTFDPNFQPVIQVGGAQSILDVPKSAKSNRGSLGDSKPIHTDPWEKQYLGVHQQCRFFVVTSNFEQRRPTFFFLVKLIFYGFDPMGNQHFSPPFGEYVYTHKV